MIDLIDEAKKFVQVARQENHIPDDELAMIEGLISGVSRLQKELAADDEDIIKLSRSRKHWRELVEAQGEYIEWIAPELTRCKCTQCEELRARIAELSKEVGYDEG